MGAMGQRRPANAMLKLTQLAVIVTLLASLTLAAQNFEQGPARSPHGPLNVACTSCHTATSWTPLRSVLEFSHGTTGFALLGLHANVDCRLCHTKLVFANVGKKCADCHADIHRRQFGAQCEQCHTVKGWQGASVQAVRTHQNRFPLLGAHAAAECESCHRGAASAQYTGLSTDCASCHLKSYQQTKAFNHQAAAMPLNCAQCHGVDDWRALSFDHNQFSGFTLDGAHARVECGSCHKAGTFTGTPKDCFSCHAPQYSATLDPNHAKAGFPKDCSNCHTPVTWAGATFNHASMAAYQLTGAHTRLDCNSCHKNGAFAATRGDCYSCHISNYEAVKNPNHAASRFPTDCTSCHNTTNWQGAKFDHSLARFQLTGAHVQAACTQCHVGGQYTGTAAQCSACHLTNYQKSTNPNHAAAGFPQDCAACHTSTQWTGAAFDHNRTRFALTGAHTQPTCAQCHTGGAYSSTSTQCSACHLTNYQKTINPNHATAGLPQDCILCHTATQWTGASFNHSTATHFPLTGAHTQATCTQCHSSGVYAGLAATCVSCHLTNYQKTANPNHAAAGFSQDCNVCHTNTQWTGAVFDHSRAHFALTGAHTQAACTQCHSTGVYAGLAATCVSCHLTNYQKTTTPNHAAAGMPQDCTLCHQTTQWTGAAFNHSTATHFPLTGAHTQATCTQCHSSGVYTGLATTCVSCHLANYQKTANPNHAAAGFSQDCNVCHTTTQWTGAVFDHSRARFALTGAHTQAACTQCHSSGVYAGLATTCVSCHLTNYQKTTTPNHPAAGFPQDCTLCHTTTQWTGAVFNHSTSTHFPLTGAHVQATCTQCHSSGVYAGLATTCVSCHLTNYQKTTTPNHAAAGFPQDCVTCHTTTQWTGAAFNHTTATHFPLTGAHVQATCTQCHSSGVYAGLATTCVSCHLTNYQKTTNPNHSTAGLPQDCILCHTTTQWTGASFNHSTATTFPLAGAHVQATCAQCHSSGVYAGLATTCVSCHLTNYQKTTNPNHAAAGLPQTCSTCHTTTAWTPASFNHTTATTFPLTGAHLQATCAQCHSSGVYAGLATTCVSCHLTNYQKTTNPNHAAAGFPQTCSTCHTTTAWTPASFNHTTATTFPLTGAHLQATCAQCHSSGVYAGLATTCVSCHLTNYQKTTTPNHTAAGLPQNCILCHTTTQWTGASFNHTTATTFPLTGAHVQATCAQCHSSGVYAGLATTCVSCHLTNYQKTTNPNHTSAGLPQTCANCHTTTAWTPASFNHNTATTFPLTGAHVQATCAQCHSSGVYAGLATTCVSCHLTNYQKTTNPNHASSGFPQTCSVCHTTTAWTPASFNHTHGDHVPADWSARVGFLRPVPFVRRLCGPRYDLRDMPSVELPEHDQSEALRGRLPAGLLRLPFHGYLGRRCVRSLEGALPAGRTAYFGALRHLPCERRVRGARHHLRLVPPVELPEDDESRPFDRRLPPAVRTLPHAGRVGSILLQSRFDSVPAHRGAHNGSVRQLPYRREVCGNSDGLLLVP